MNEHILTIDSIPNLTHNPGHRDKYQKLLMEAFPELYAASQSELTRSERIAREWYKLTATKDVDPDLGFSELLDVL